MKKIFILDDNQDFLDILQLLLKPKFIVECKMDNINLDEALKTFNPDLMIIDHFIGVVLAENVLNTLRESIPGLNFPIILFSASSNLKEKAERIGAAGFIEKPSSIDYIRKYIDNIFSTAIEKSL